MEVSDSSIWAWKNCPEYTVLDVLLLAIGYLPVDFDTFLQTPNPDKELYRRYLNKLREMLFNDSPDFKKYVQELKGEDNHRRFCAEPLSRQTATDYLTKLVGTPNFLTETDGESQLPQIDRNHPLISDEFKIALQAWEAVLAPNPPRPKRGSRKKLIRDWLEKFPQKLSDEAKNRIATLLNPDSNGGAPPAG